MDTKRVHKESGGTREGDPRLLPVLAIAHPAPVCAPTTSIREAAQMMAAAGTTAILVRSEDGRSAWGIVTDFDLSTKVVAVSLPVDRPVSDIMTTPIHTIGPDRLVEDAVLEMLEKNVHHLPVTDGVTTFGMVSQLDILAAEALHPFRVQREVAGARTAEELAEAASGLPAAIAGLSGQGTGARGSARVMALLTDAISKRALDLAMEELGVPPSGWAWMTLGSHARREQGLLTDQDHALVLEDQTDDPYFEKLATAVVSTLERCGLARCPAKMMASEPGFRRTTADWNRGLEGWIEETDRFAAFVAEILLDCRQIAGSINGVAVFHQAIERAAANDVFMTRLLRLALSQRIPLRGIRRRISLRGGVVDIKAGGVRAATELARVFGIKAGCTAPESFSRLEAATSHGGLGAEHSSSLAESLEALLDIRLAHQIRRWRRGEPIDEAVRGSELGPVDQARLREALRQVRLTQEDIGRQLSLRVR